MKVNPVNSVRFVQGRLCYPVKKIQSNGWHAQVLLSMVFEPLTNVRGLYIKLPSHGQKCF